MMRLPPFDYRAPGTVEEAARILAGEGPSAAILGGGTDLFPNMKRRHQTPSTLVSLRGVAGLHEARSRAGGLHVGPGVTLSAIADSPEIAADYPALRRAAAQVATPMLRNAATLGGNICLDTRCTYYDQNQEWRQAISFCLKREGDTCWVAPSSPKCLAVSSTDCAPALIALRGEVTLVSTSGERRVLLAELYVNDGINYLTRRPDEVLSSVDLPSSREWRSTYWKLRRRGSIDFPVLGVAAALKVHRGACEDVSIVLGAVASKPQVASEAATILRGHELTDDLIDEAAEAAAKLAKPMDNTDFQLHWRKAVVAPYVAGALRQLRGDDPDTFGPLARRAAMAVSAFVT